ncbi:MAG: histidinol-phosphate aminotransferase [Paenibacillaceae bacterium]|jgi:histidinol-phosphate aminotransferase|nr:histidinol-phosphate aminotransferase [Paenibacillaceae bacterium]
MQVGLPYRISLDAINPYIPGKRLEEAVKELGIERVVKLASNENPLGCSPRVYEAVKKVLEAPSRYPDGNSTELRAELSRQTGLTPQQFVIGAGSFELISFVAETFIGPGDEAIMPVPSFSWYGTVTRLREGKVVPVGLTAEHGVNLKAILAAITERTRVIWLCNPNNPTGTLLPGEELAQFLEAVPRHIVVALDEAYCDFIGEPGYPDSLEWLYRFEHVVVLRTFSKIHGLASMRIGYAAASERTISYFNRVRQIFNVNALAQAAAVASLRDKDFRRRVFDNNRQGKEYLYGEFQRLGFSYIKSEASFVMVHVREDSDPLFQQLLREGVIIRPGTGFGMKEWLRVSVGTEEENRIFIEALERAAAGGLRLLRQAGSLSG